MGVEENGLAGCPSLERDDRRRPPGEGQVSAHGRRVTRQLGFIGLKKIDIKAPPRSLMGDQLYQWLLIPADAGHGDASTEQVQHRGIDFIDGIGSDQRCPLP